MGIQFEINFQPKNAQLRHRVNVHIKVVVFLRASEIALSNLLKGVLDYDYHYDDDDDDHCDGDH